MFMQDLITEIQKIEKDLNNLCILMWDANESIDDKSGNVRKHLAETKFRTYSRRSRQGTNIYKGNQKN
jgi:predicted transcriptional regulator